MSEPEPVGDDVGVNCAGCNEFITLSEIQHLTGGKGFCRPCTNERFREDTDAE